MRPLFLSLILMAFHYGSMLLMVNQTGISCWVVMVDYYQQGIEEITALVPTEHLLVYEVKQGLVGPSSTWTYLFTDDAFSGNFENSLVKKIKKIIAGMT